MILNLRALHYDCEVCVCVCVRVHFNKNLSGWNTS